MRKSFLIIALALLILVACQPKANTSTAENNVEAVEDTDGEDYQDFEMFTPQGGTVKISDFISKNKYTLIDFWASWCGPCRREMPYVVKAYNDFHSKGLEVVGVSLDKEHDAWINGIKELGMTWPQMSDLKGWDCEGAQLYGVRSIPANFLFNQNGEIVAQDLREDELGRVLGQLLGE